MNKPAVLVRLDKLLANLGYGSRRVIQTLARGGRVLLDGVPVADAETRMELTPDLVTRLFIDGTPLDPLPGVVLMMNKPLGMTCSHKEATPLVYDLLPQRWRLRAPPISSIGRLDKDTSGLLLLTDDGPLLHRIIAPKALIAKRYRVVLARPLRGDEGAIFASGRLMLNGEAKPLLPAHLVVEADTCATVTIREGRYHQLRRMFAAVGNHVVALHRDRLGGLSLPDTLEAGCYSQLDVVTVAKIFNLTNFDETNI